ncbi:ABC transporter substrate-binding protein, partial [Butyricicoccus sp. 1XD8-22]
GEISYAGTAAMERAYLVEDILKERLQEHFHNLHIDLIGVSSVHRTQFEKIVPYEVRVRAAGYHHSQKIAQLIGEEVEALYTNGPAAGGGVRKKVTETIGVVSTLIDRNQVKPKITLFDNHIR